MTLLLVVVWAVLIAAHAAIPLFANSRNELALFFVAMLVTVAAALASMIALVVLWRRSVGGEKVRGRVIGFVAVLALVAALLVSGPYLDDWSFGGGH